MAAMTTRYKTIADLCRSLEWARSTLDYHIWVSQMIPRPTHRRGRGRRWYYTDQEVVDIVAMVNSLQK